MVWFVLILVLNTGAMTTAEFRYEETCKAALADILAQIKEEGHTSAQGGCYKQ